jgi:hypothetical protein
MEKINVKNNKTLKTEKTLIQQKPTVPLTFILMDMLWQNFGHLTFLTVLPYFSKIEFNKK